MTEDDKQVLRERFVHFLTTASPMDRRRKDFRLQTFDRMGGWAVWHPTTLDQVTRAFDLALREDIPC